MERIEQYRQQAAVFQRQRANAARVLHDIEQRRESDLRRLTEGFVKQRQSNEAWGEQQRQQIAAQAARRTAGYANTKQLLNDYPAQAAQFCGELPQHTGYVPRPEKMDEQRLAELLRMLSEGGILAWIKRTFRLGGYRSRKEMAVMLYDHVRDAQAYCDVQIEKITREAQGEQQSILVEVSRRNKALTEQEKTRRAQLLARLEEETEAAKQNLADCTMSPELQKLITDLRRQREIARQTYGKWGEFAPPDTVPHRLLLGEVTVDVMDAHGVEKPVGIPYWLPLDRSSIVVLTSDIGSGGRKELVRQVLARMLKSVEYSHNRVSVFDTLHKGGSLERLIGVSNVGSAKLSVDVFSEPAVCKERRKYLAEQIAHTRKLLEGRCDLYAYHKEKGDDNEIPFHWLVEFDMPDRLNDEAWEQYRVLFTNAAYCGFSFLFETSSAGLEQIRSLAAGCGGLNLVHLDMDRMLVNGQYPFALCAEPSAVQLDNFMDAISAYFAGADTMDNTLLTYYRRNAHPTRDCGDGLRLPVAIDDCGKPVYFELSNSGNVHALITGATRSGKSTLLHTLIMGATLEYHPDDLALWLVDYKQIEFETYNKLRPPHVKLVGLSKTRDFTFSLLDFIEAEFDRRQERFRYFDVTSLSAYREHRGEPGYVHFPRIFLIVDEFHKMSQHIADEPRYKTVLENVMSEYGALGLNCLLSDQAVSVGLQGLTDKARQQIGLRMSMRHTSLTEIKETLNVDASLYSEAVTRMLGRLNTGDVVMKRQTYMGDQIADVYLEKFRVLYATKEDRQELYALMGRYYAGRYTPGKLLYVCSKEQVPWDEADRIDCDAAEPLHHRDLRLYLGRPTTLRPCFAVDLQRKLNENVCVVGGTAEQRWDVIAGAVNSARYKQGTAVKLFVAEESAIEKALGRRISELAGRQSNVELLVTTEQWCGALSALEERAKDRSDPDDVLCVFVGLSDMQQEMKLLPQRQSAGAKPAFSNPFAVTFDSPSFDTDFGTVSAVPPPREDETFDAMPIVHSLLMSGARTGVHCVLEAGVYRELRSLFRAEEYCTHRIAFAMSEDDAAGYLGRGAFAREIDGFGVYHSGGNTVAQIIPYRGL